MDGSFDTRTYSRFFSSLMIPPAREPSTVYFCQKRDQKRSVLFDVSPHIHRLGDNRRTLQQKKVRVYIPVDGSMQFQTRSTNAEIQKNNGNIKNPSLRLSTALIGSYPSKDRAAGREWRIRARFTILFLIFEYVSNPSLFFMLQVRYTDIYNSRVY